MSRIINYPVIDSQVVFVIVVVLVFVYVCSFLFCVVFAIDPGLIL